jgi:hypothetical protein
MSKANPAHRASEAAVCEDLRDMFDQIADQPVPTRLIDLVDALEEMQRFQEACNDDA